MQRKNVTVYTMVIILGMLIGGYLSELLTYVMPDGVAKDFFLTSVVGSFGPVSIDLLIIAFTLGPFIIKVNLISVLGIFIASYLYKSTV